MPKKQSAAQALDGLELQLVTKRSVYMTIDDFEPIKRALAKAGYRIVPIPKKKRVRR